MEDADISSDAVTTRILTVCLGNICRSPAAEAVIRAKARAADVDVEVDSAGTAGYHTGEPPHRQSVAVGARRGYEVVGRGRRLTAEDFRTFDLIVTMDENNLRDAQRMAPADATAKVVALRSFDAGGDGDLEVPDPWGQPDTAYEHMYDLVENAVDGLIASLR